MEIQTSSSGSGHVISDRWQGGHDPLDQPPLARSAGVGEEAPPDNGFPPFVKVRLGAKRALGSWLRLLSVTSKKKMGDDFNFASLE